MKSADRIFMTVVLFSIAVALYGIEKDLFTIGDIMNRSLEFQKESEVEKVSTGMAEKDL